MRNPPHGHICASVCVCVCVGRVAQASQTHGFLSVFNSNRKHLLRTPSTSAVAVRKVKQLDGESLTLASQRFPPFDLLSSPLGRCFLPAWLTEFAWSPARLAWPPPRTRVGILSATRTARVGQAALPSFHSDHAQQEALVCLLDLTSG